MPKGKDRKSYIPKFKVGPGNNKKSVIMPLPYPQRGGLHTPAANADNLRGS